MLRAASREYATAEMSVAHWVDEMVARRADAWVFQMAALKGDQRVVA